MLRENDMDVCEHGIPFDHCCKECEQDERESEVLDDFDDC